MYKLKQSLMWIYAKEMKSNKPETFLSLLKLILKMVIGKYKNHINFRTKVQTEFLRKIQKQNRKRGTVSP